MLGKPYLFIPLKRDGNQSQHQIIHVDNESNKNDPELIHEI
jgi:hypothetical protein